VLAVTVPIGLRAEKLTEAIALQGSIRDARGLRVRLADWPESGNTREFIGKIQTKIPKLPQRHRGTELETTDEHR
jgi:hypothetical protein